MKQRVAIIGAGVSGLTCGVFLAERGYSVSIFAEEIGRNTTSAAAAAVWFPYDAEPVDQVIGWALETYNVLLDLSRDSDSGVSMIELRQFSRSHGIQIPDWAIRLGSSPISSEAERSSIANPVAFKAGFTITVPLMDTTIYLDYLATRFVAAAGEIHTERRFEKLEDVDSKLNLVVNCAGIGARELVRDVDLEPHRGQVAVVSKIDHLSCAVVCDDTPLMYAIPRRNDCVFGGTNELSEDRHVDPAVTSVIVAECSRVLNIDKPRVLAERVGLRPFRRSGVRLEAEKLRDGRSVIHNYGHGGSGFTLSWGCARKVFELAESSPEAARRARL